MIWLRYSGASRVVKEKDGKIFDAFTDAEQRYRQRYLDLIVNPQVKDVFVKRTKMINAIRQFFNERGYLSRSQFQ